MHHDSVPGKCPRGPKLSAHRELSEQTLPYIKRKFSIQRYIVIFIRWEKPYIVFAYVFNFQFQLFHQCN